MLRVSVVLLSVLCVAYAKPGKISDEIGCYVKDLDDVIPIGQVVASRSSCMEYRCEENLLTYITCGAVNVEPPTELVEDTSKPYPGCCPKRKDP